MIYQHTTEDTPKSQKKEDNNKTKIEGWNRNKKNTGNVSKHRRARRKCAFTENKRAKKGTEF